MGFFSDVKKTGTSSTPSSSGGFFSDVAKKPVTQSKSPTPQITGPLTDPVNLLRQTPVPKQRIDLGINTGATANSTKAAAPGEQDIILNTIRDTAIRFPYSAYKTVTGGAETAPILKTPLGDVETYQRAAARRVAEGENPTIAAGKEAGMALLDEPLGLATKPFLAVGGILLGKFLNRGSREAIEQIARSSNAAEIEDILRTKFQITEGADRLAQSLTTVSKADDVATVFRSIASQKKAELNIFDDTPKKAPAPRTDLDDTLDVLTDAKDMPTKFSSYQRLKTSLSEWWTNTRESFEDERITVKRLTSDPSVLIDDASNPYLKARLFQGRFKPRIQEGYDTINTIDNDILASSRKLGVPDTQLTKDVNNYLIARHAPERNAALGDGAAGLTTEDAKNLLTEIENKKEAADIKRIADQLDELNRKTLDVLKEGGVITDELYETLRTKYKHHVPLNRVFEEAEDFAQALNGGRGFDVKSTGLKKAVGSDREVADIMTNIVANYDMALIRAEKNIVDNATLQFARKNKQLGIFEEVKPEVVGTNLDGKPIFKFITDPQVLHLFEKGKPKYLRINDPKLAAALRGVNRQKLDAFTRFIGAFTRFYAQLNTRLYPEFAATNKLRDLQEAMVYAASNPNMGFRGALALPLRDPISLKTVYKALRGIDDADTRLYKQMIADGGTTGGYGLSTRKDVELNIEKIRKLNRSAPRRAAVRVLETIDSWNQVFEDSTRLTAYKQALDRGLSREQAALIARDVTIDFNKMGTKGPIINSVYMFSNVSIQGSVKLLRAMKQPKVAAAVFTTVGASVWTINEWNDSVDPDWRSKITKWDRFNGLPIMVPSDDPDKVDYIIIPVSWGLKPIKVAMDNAYDLAYGQGDADDAMETIFASLVEGYNPLGGTNIMSAVTPTALDLPLELYSNISWTGSRIRKDFDPNDPASIQYFNSIREKWTGQQAIRATEKLSGLGIEISPASIHYAYEQLIGGLGRSATKIVNLVSDISKGEAPEVGEVPFLSRFYKRKDVEETGFATEEFDVVEKYEGQESKESFYLKQRAEDTFDVFSKLPPEEAALRFEELTEKDPELAEKVVEVAEDKNLNLTNLDKSVRQLGVENGQRALYLYDRFSRLETDEERAALWSEYIEKKIITEAVAEQLNYLFANPDSVPVRK